MKVFSTGDGVDGLTVVCEPAAGVDALVYTFTAINEGTGAVQFCAQVLRPDGTQGTLWLQTADVGESIKFPPCVVEGGGGNLTLFLQGNVLVGAIYGWYASGIERLHLT